MHQRYMLTASNAMLEIPVINVNNMSCTLWQDIPLCRIHSLYIWVLIMFLQPVLTKMLSTAITTQIIYEISYLSKALCL